MNPTTFDTQKAALDAALAKARPEVGVRLGSDFYRELGARGLLTLSPFNLTGLGGPTIDLPTYAGHYAFDDWGLELEEFEVGA